MTLTVIQKDLLTITEGIIAHQVNCMGKMGAGLALAIKKLYPEVYAQYLEGLRKESPLGLGDCQLVKISNTEKSLYVANLFGQYRYGRDQKYTQDWALSKSLHLLYHAAKRRGLQPYLPYGLGCGNAGGDWDTVYQLIKENCPNAIICQKP